jgi:hypothetical protein
MEREKQLAGVQLEDVVRKRQLDQALNAKEFATLAGVSYSVAREWFHLPGFPALRGFVFWSDFVEWRRRQYDLGQSSATSPSPVAVKPASGPLLTGLPAKAARLLLEAG